MTETIVVHDPRTEECRADMDKQLQINEPIVEFIDRGQVKTAGIKRYVFAIVVKIPGKKDMVARFQIPCFENGHYLHGVDSWQQLQGFVRGLQDLGPATLTETEE